MENFFSLQDMMSSDAEFFPLMSAEDEELMRSEEIPEVIPILPVRNTVLFPGVVLPITAGRDKSIKLIRNAYQENDVIGVVAQKDPTVDDPGSDDFYQIGTVARIIKILQMPDGNTTAIIQGKKRFRLLEITSESPYFKGRVESFEPIEETPKNDVFTALIASSYVIPKLIYKGRGRSNPIMGLKYFASCSLVILEQPSRDEGLVGEYKIT